MESLVGIRYRVVCCVLKAENELRIAQSEFDRHAEVTRLLLEGLGSSHVSDMSIFSVY